MKKTMIRLLSLMLCLVTLVSMLPVTAAASTTLGAPKNLKINKTWSYSDNKLITRYGSIAWQPQKPYVAGDYTWYEISLYKDGDRIFSMQSGHNLNKYPQEYLYEDMSPFIESSGTYHFAVRANSDKDKYAASKTVTSSKWTYTRPSTKTSKPQNPKWDWPNMTWTPIKDNSVKYQVEVYYSPTKPDSLKDMYKTRMNWHSTMGFSDMLSYGNEGPGYYRFRVRTISSNIKEKRHSDWVTSDVYQLKLAKPTNVKVAQASSGSKPKISWSKVAAAAKYEIYRATSKDGEYSKIKTTTSSSYTDENASRGRTYYYKVRSVAASGAKSSFCTPVEFIYKLAKPTVKTSNVSSSGKIKLTWGKVSGAKEYKVYRATKEDGEYTLVKTTTSTSYTNTSAKAGQRYYYKVKAIAPSSKANSSYSAVVNHLCDLSRPEVSIKLNSKNKPRLSWDEVNGAAEYQIYRATSKSGTYELKKTTGNTYYTDTSAKSGKTYYYKVVAVHQNSSANSAKSTVVSIKSK